MATHDVESIEVDRTSHVLLRFEDGLTVRFGLPALRLACPCADCNAKRGQDRPVTHLPDDDLAAIRITDATMAGAWGLNLDWSDGHSTGIYAFEHLRDWAERGLVDADVTRA
jgi:DUF971 family protein